MKKRAAGKKAKKAAGSKGVRDLTARKTARGGLTLATTTASSSLIRGVSTTLVAPLDPYRGISLEA